jgi:hypothetical protein
MTIRSHRSFAALALALAVPVLAAGPLAAQTGGTGTGVVMDRPAAAPRGAAPMRPAASSGATTTGPIGTGSGGATRPAAGRLDDETARTALLNRFGGLGFAALESFRRTGDGYEAEVRTITGERMTVDIDPRTGEVMTRR